MLRVHRVKKIARIAWNEINKKEETGREREREREGIEAKNELKIGTCNVPVNEISTKKKKKNKRQSQSSFHKECADATRRAWRSTITLTQICRANNTVAQRVGESWSAESALHKRGVRVYFSIGSGWK